MVYLDCDANGQWVMEKNTSECDPNDLTVVSDVSTYCLRGNREKKRV